MSDAVVKRVRTIEVGNSQYRHFIDNRTATNKELFYDTISRKNLLVPLFKSCRKKSLKMKAKLAIELFSCQSRIPDMGT